MAQPWECAACHTGFMVEEGPTRPHVLPCGHTFCLKCIEASVECLECSVQTQGASAPNQALVTALRERAAGQAPAGAQAPAGVRVQAPAGVQAQAQALRQLLEHLDIRVSPALLLDPDAFELGDVNHPLAMPCYYNPRNAKYRGKRVRVTVLRLKDRDTPDVLRAVVKAQPAGLVGLVGLVGPDRVGIVCKAGKGERGNVRNVLERGLACARAIRDVHARGVTVGTLTHIGAVSNGRAVLSEVEDMRVHDAVHYVRPGWDAVKPSVKHDVFYAAPELLPEGRPTPESDVYAWACVLCSELTSRPPALWSEEASGDPEKYTVGPWAPVVPLALPASVRHLLLDCLASEPRDRPTAAQLVSRLHITRAQLEDGPKVRFRVVNAVSGASATLKRKMGGIRSLEEDEFLEDACRQVGAEPGASRLVLRRPASRGLPMHDNSVLGFACGLTAAELGPGEGQHVDAYVLPRDTPKLRVKLELPEDGSVEVEVPVVPHMQERHVRAAARYALERLRPGTRDAPLPPASRELVWVWDNPDIVRAIAEGTPFVMRAGPVDGGMTVSAKMLTGRTHTVWCEREPTALELYQDVSFASGVPMDQLRLIYRDRQVAADGPMYPVADGAVFNVVLRWRG